ncbi:MAG: Multidrug export protein EmrB [Chlamydiales bacterium]|nr:Multidrug export protein EmrB [Chlamydiales bacterium]
MDSEGPLSGFKLFLATLAVSVGTLLITLDQFIANVALPTIAGELGVSQDNGTWVITSYTVANAIMVPLTGWMTSFIGRVRLFSISAVLFALMSLMCGLSTTFPMLLIFRVFQGLVSGSLIPLSQALLLMLFPHKKGFAMGMWGLVVMVGPAIGPVLGGWITGSYSWQWIFNLNVPLGVLAGIVAYALLSGFESERKKLPIDLVGIALLVATVGCYQVMLDRGTDDDWFRSNFILALGIIAFIGLCFFLVWEHFHAHPVVDLSFFKNRNFTFGTLIISVAVFFIFGNLVVGPTWAQDQLGYTPLWAGYAIAPLGFSALFVFPLVGLYLHLIDLRIWVAVGLALVGSAFFYLAYLSIHTPFANLAWPRFVQGIGFALFFVPLTTMSLKGIPEHRMASAAGVFSFARMMAISSGVSLATSYFSMRENFFQSRYAEMVIPSNPQFAPYFAALKTQLGLEGSHAHAFVYKMAQNQAYTETFLELCYLAGWGCAILLCLLVFFRSPKKKAQPLHVGG